MKLFYFISLASLLNICNSFGQCCNVFASNGRPVSSSEGTCVTLTYPTSDCNTDMKKKDTDGDGVNDNVDKCPEIKGNATNEGCPAITAEIWEVFTNAIDDVNFATNSDTLILKSATSLDKAVMMMKENKDFKLKISGYADSVGTKEYNKELSERRALSVKNYLSEKGIKEKRISVIGYGETMPKSNNGSNRGRAVNRRVEFDLYY